MKRTALIAAVAAVLVGTAQAAVTELIIYKQPNFKGPSQTIKGEVNVLEGGFANEASSLIVRGGYWEVCTENHFKGDCRVLAPGEYPRLDASLNRTIVSTRFLGNDQRLAKRAEKEDRREAREERREAREERREERWQERHAAGSIDLYGRPGFRGRSIRVDDNIGDLGRHTDFDGRASSVVVNGGVWQLCSEPRFEGICRTYGPGHYEHLAELNDRVSSMRRIR